MVLMYVTSYELVVVISWIDGYKLGSYIYTYVAAKVLICTYVYIVVICM